MSDFKEIVVGDFFMFKFMVVYWFVVWMDVMFRWYFFVEGSVLWIIKNIDDEELSFVGKFDIKVKWKCFEDDVYDLYMLVKCYSVDFILDLEIVLNDVIFIFVEMDIDKNSGVIVMLEWIVLIQVGLENEVVLLKGMFGIFCYIIILLGKVDCVIILKVIVGIGKDIRCEVFLSCMNIIVEFW